MDMHGGCSSCGSVCSCMDNKFDLWIRHMSPRAVLPGCRGKRMTVLAAQSEHNLWEKSSIAIAA